MTTDGHDADLATEQFRGASGIALRLDGKAIRRALAAVTCGLAALVGPVASASASSGSASASYHTGLKLSLGSAPSAAKTEQVQAAAASLPASVDLTADAMPVGDQGGVNSCAAWATIYGALGYWENEEGISGGALAPMYTYSQVDGGVDDGSYIDSNLDIARAPDQAGDQSHQGVDVQSDYTQGNFDYLDQPTAAERKNAARWQLSGYSDLYTPMDNAQNVTQQSIEEALAGGDPVVIGFYVYASFEDLGSADNGFYAGPTGNDTYVGTHAVVALGYNANGLVIENQWGTAWGDSGWATLSWSFVNSNVLEATAVGPLIPQAAPANTVAPTVTGVPDTSNAGSTVSVSAGTWSPTPNLFPTTTPAITYQWQRWEFSSQTSWHWVSIPGATSSSYTLAAADVGYALRALVSASDGFGTSQAGTSILGPVTVLPPKDQSLPSISGTTQQGQTLTAATGTWSPGGDSYGYQWLRKPGGSSTWSAISGATKSTYAPTSADLNGLVEVTVTATVGASHVSATSSPVGPISLGPPNVTVLPSISGTPTEGQTLTASSGTWNPTGTITYQWQSLPPTGGLTWSNIAGATGATYVPTDAVLGGYLRVQVSVANSLATSTVPSSTVGPVASGAPANSAAPTVKGTAARGSVLTATAGTWTPAATFVTYQWQQGTASAGWTNITGATAASYTAAHGDEGLDLRVVVTASNAYGPGTAAASAATGTVSGAAPASVSGHLPTVSSTKPALGVKLTATTGTWTGVGNTYAYQWSHSTTHGLVAITGATASTFTPGSTDAGSALVVTVTATNPDGTAKANSAVTAVVPSAKTMGVAAPEKTKKPKAKAKGGHAKR